MKTIYLHLIIHFCLSITLRAKSDSLITDVEIVLQTANGKLFGSLCAPKTSNKVPLAIIICGSGSIDRDGNSAFLKTNIYKLLAKDLAQNNIASVRFDKRGAGKSKDTTSKENILFEDNINDVKSWIDLLKRDNRFSKVVIIGHSEGSLVGILASSEADKFISVAGPGRKLDIILKEQLNKQFEESKPFFPGSDELKKNAFTIIDSLVKGKTTEKVSPLLLKIFKPSSQSYLISCFKYDPFQEISKVSVPTLIVQGKRDIQVNIEDAKILAKGNKNAKLVFIKKMNHVFRNTRGNTKKDQLNTYMNPNLPISRKLVKKIVQFIIA